MAISRWRNGAGPRALLNQRVSRLQWYSTQLEPLFVFIAAQQKLSELQGRKAYTTVDHLSSKQIEDAVVPLPPLAEQKRIVAKVGELMALCHRLEAQQQGRELHQAALTRAAIARFDEAPTPANLSYLFHNSYSINPSDLRKTILNLAVQGKLVPFDPIDDKRMVGDHIEFLNPEPSDRRTLLCIDEAPIPDDLMARLEAVKKSLGYLFGIGGLDAST